MKLYVGNLPANTSAQDLESLFTPYGDVRSARVLAARHSGHPRGFGYVEMSKQHAEVAMSELNGHQIDCMVLRVNESKSKLIEKLRQSISIIFMFLFGLQLFIGIPDHAAAQMAADGIPENAEATSYGREWRCNRGYLESDGACAAIEIPENAYATRSSYGAGWKCSHGFKKTDGSCTPTRVPANAHLDPVRGDSWKCNRGYRAVDDTCVVIDVPANGYLSDEAYGSGWACDRGYRSRGDTCVVVNIPENAYPTYATYGSGWECHRGYRENNGACKSVIVPVNGYLTEASHGSGWACKRGFRADGDKCTELQVPANAHLDYSGNNWKCNEPYSKRSESCVLLHGK